jgi:hypothetical protein
MNGVVEKSKANLSALLQALCRSFLWDLFPMGIGEM